MKGFGFPGKAPQDKPTPSYRADTSHQKSELVSTLRKSEQLWNEE